MYKIDLFKVKNHRFLHGPPMVKVAKSFCKNTKYCSAKSKFTYLLSVEFVINQSTNFKSGQSVLAIHDSPPYCLRSVRMTS